MAEDRMTVETLTLKELVWGAHDQTWREKIDEIRSQGGGFASIAAGASLDLASQITGTDLLTGRGTLSSGGIRFWLKDLIVANVGTHESRVILYDSTGKKMYVYVTTGGTAGAAVYLQGLHGKHFSTDCRVGTTSSAVKVTVGGIRETILV